MIGVTPKNLNEKTMIPVGAKGKAPAGTLSLLNSKNSKPSVLKNEFQALMEGEITSDENLNFSSNQLGTEINLKNKVAKTKSVLQNKPGNGLQLTKDNDAGEILGSDLENKTLIDKKIKPLKLGLSSNGNQKFDKRIDEYLNNQNNPKISRSLENNPARISAESLQNNKLHIAGSSVYATPAGTDALTRVNSTFNKYQKNSAGDNNVIKLGAGENKNSKRATETIEGEIKTDNLLDFTLKQDLGSNQINTPRSSEHSSLMPELAMMKNEKVLNLDQISINDPKALIDKITNYMVEKNFENKSVIDLTVKHHELGEFRVSASKIKQSDRIDLEIFTTSDKGHRFFVDNEQLMVKSLSNLGIKLTDIKISSGQETFMTSQDDKSFSKQHSYFDKTTQYSFSDDNESADDDSQRRKMLWEMFKERKEA